MNKKLTNVLRTNVTLYFICLVLFALAAIPFDVRLAIGEGAAAVLLLIIARRRSRSVQQSMRQYMDRFTGGMDSARSSNMLFAPLPMMVFDADTQAVVWCNDGFLELTEQKEGVFDAHRFPSVGCWRGKTSARRTWCGTTGSIGCMAA